MSGQWRCAGLLVDHLLRPDALLQKRGFGLRIVSPISGVAIDFLGEIYVDDTNLIVTHPDLETPEAVLECLNSSAEAWSSGLNSTGGAINPDKSRWILASYEWLNGIWGYGQQPQVGMTISLPNGTPAPISNGQVTTVEKSLLQWCHKFGRLLSDCLALFPTS